LNVLDISGCLNFTADSVSGLFGSGLEQIESLNMSGLPLNESVINSAISFNKYLKILRVSNCIGLSSSMIDNLISSESTIYLLEINRSKDIPEAKIEELIKKKSPNLRVIRSVNIFLTAFQMKDFNLKIPLPAPYHSKPNIKGKKPAPKKNDDKNPINQMKKLEEEMKPKKIINMVYKKK